MTQYKDVSRLAMVNYLNNAIDQLASEAIDVDATVAAALDIAWYYTEHELRKYGQSSCGHNLTFWELIRENMDRSIHCGCCSDYVELHNRAENIQRML